MPLVWSIHANLIVVVVVWNRLLLFLSPKVVVGLVVILIEVKICCVCGLLALVNSVLLQVVVVQVDHAAEAIVFQLVKFDRPSDLGKVCLCQKRFLVLSLKLLQVLIAGLRVDLELFCEFGPVLVLSVLLDYFFNFVYLVLYCLREVR